MLGIGGNEDKEENFKKMTVEIRAKMQNAETHAAKC